MVREKVMHKVALFQTSLLIRLFLLPPPSLPLSLSLSFSFFMPFCRQITQRVLNLSMLSKSMDFKAIHGEVMKITVDEYKIDRSKCVGFMLDGCGANMKALDTLLLNFPNAVGVRCFSHLLNNCGNELSSEETDKFAGHLHVLLAHSHNARDLWLQETKVSPPKPVSHRWSSRYVRNNALVLNWQQMKTFVDKFTSTEESRSKSAAAMREELGRVRPDGVHQELILQLGFAVAVDVGIHLVRPTHLLEGDGFLVSTYPRGPYISHLPFVGVVVRCSSSAAICY